MGLTFNAFMHITSALVSRLFGEKRAKGECRSMLICFVCIFYACLALMHFMQWNIFAACTRNFSCGHSSKSLLEFLISFTLLSLALCHSVDSLQPDFVCRPCSSIAFLFCRKQERWAATALFRFACKCKCSLIFPFFQYRPLKSRANR